MKKKIYVILSVLLVILLVIFGGIYFVNNAKKVTKNPLVITDTSKKEVSFSKTPEKVISLIPAATETLYDLGLGEKVIAVDSYSNYPEDAKSKKQLKTSTALNVEEIVSLNSDIVFMSKMGQTIEQYNSLVNAGVKVVIVDATSINETYDIINLIGKIMNKEKEASKICNNMKKDLEDIRLNCINKEKKSIYYEVSPLEFGLWTSGNNTFENEIFNILNIDNIFKNVKGWAQVSEEQVLTKNPDYIVSTSMDFGEVKVVDEILNRKNWNNISAIKNKKVYSINSDIMSRPTKRLVEGAKELQKIVYGK
ncbi:MAG: ABC transporter substrate-binding protein [Clostridia bacterium]